MEQKLQIVTKKLFKIVRVIYFMLRKGISKFKLLADLNFMMNRAKIAGKLSSIHNLMFHNHHPSTANENTVSYQVPLNKYEYEHEHGYEFSCKNSPAYTTFHLPFHLIKRKNHSSLSHDDVLLFAASLELAANSVAISPALPGFGRTPVVRQLRISDSPFLLSDIEEDRHVDEAAEEFIKRFHRDLRQQNAIA